jgi:hypothetical protein
MALNSVLQCVATARELAKAQRERERKALPVDQEAREWWEQVYNGKGSECTIG